MEPSVGLPASSRVRAYIDYKKECLAGINAAITPIADSFARDLARVNALNPALSSREHTPLAAGLGIAEQEDALLSARDQAYKLPPASVIAEVHTVLQRYQSNYDLRLIGASHAPILIEGRNVFYAYALKLSCPNWQRQCAASLGYEHSIELNLEFDYTGESSIEIAGVELMELVDLIVFKSATTTYWADIASAVHGQSTGKVA